MKVSLQGLVKIAALEGIVLGPYKDTKAVPTVYIGHTAAAGGLDPSKMGYVDTRGWSQERAEQEMRVAIATFATDIAKYENRVNSAITVPIAQHEFDALVSFDVNTGGIFKAKLTAAINAYEAHAARHFLGWLKPPEIRGRREAEMALFKTGDYNLDEGLIPVYDAHGNGKISRRAVVNSEKFLGMLRNALHPTSPAPAPAPKPQGLLAAIMKFIMAIFGSRK